MGGALTTLIGVAPIAAAQFPYFRQYYFSLYVMIVLFGWLNGVIFQVVLLSFFPPRSFGAEESSSVGGQKPLAHQQQLSAHKAHETIELEEQGTTKKETETETVDANENEDGGATETGAGADGNETIESDEAPRKHTRESNNAP